MAFSSTVLSGWWASSAVTTLVSLVATSAGRRIFRSSSPSSSARLPSLVASSAVFVRLPLWASAIEPIAVGWKVGCALCHVEAPVVE